VRLKRAIFGTVGALEGSECLEVISSAHYLSTDWTVFNHPFSTGAFGGPSFSGSHTTASTFFCHVRSPPFVRKIFL
jgi:hypothetical protein